MTGPRVFICDGCVRAATELLPEGDTLGASVVYRPELPPRSESSDDTAAAADLAPHCSFCGKYPREVKAIVDGHANRICDECLALCRDILDEQAEPSNVVALNAGHPLVGTWRDSDVDGSTIRFVVRAIGERSM